jgi:hypothetical protein
MVMEKEKETMSNTERKKKWENNIIFWNLCGNKKKYLISGKNCAKIWSRNSYDIEIEKIYIILYYQSIINSMYFGGCFNSYINWWFSLLIFHFGKFGVKGGTY